MQGARLDGVGYEGFDTRLDFYLWWEGSVNCFNCLTWKDDDDDDDDEGF